MDRARILGLVDRLFAISHKLTALEAIPRDFGVGEPLTRAEIHMLQAIDESEDPSVTELARLKGITKGAVSQVLNRLAGKGLIDKRVDAQNSSRLQIALTETGQIACRGHEEMHDQVIRYTAEHVGELDGFTLDLLESVFSRIDRMLDRMLAEQG
ncbi:MAG: MarR family transcriptional regulator [Deltaproteobacteria bacterium]|nr:MarR family transcriptional regulator [Deltaproteobacteria bacterium]